MKNWIVIFLAAAILVGCDKGELLENLPPDTRISVSSIQLTGPDRLNSEVTLHWSGTDEDGYVKGYEISFDNATWTFVTSQDSVFNFDISGGTDTLDIHFWVRAIDDKDSPDPSPDYLLIPIQNTPPTVRMDSTNAIPDTSLIVFTSFWFVNDLDGSETLDSLFVRLNNGAWFSMDPSVEVATFVPTNPAATGSTTAKLYAGLVPVLLSGTIDGLNLSGDNRIYIKAKDIAGAWSDVDSTDVFFVRNQTSDLLVLDANGSASAPTPESIYFPILTTVYGNYDYLDLMGNGGGNLPQVWDPTFGFLMNLYDKIFWYSDETLVDGLLYLESASGAIQKYFNQGGKMLISAKFPTMDPGSLLFGFTPMDSLSSSAGQARIPIDSLVMPAASFAADFDTLKSSSFITGADPFYMKANAEAMFTAQIQSTGGWVGPNTVIAKTNGTTGQTNQVFVSLELNKLNGTPSTLQNFFNQVLLNEFNW